MSAAAPSVAGFFDCRDAFAKTIEAEITRNLDELLAATPARAGAAAAKARSTASKRAR